MAIAYALHIRSNSAQQLACSRRLHLPFHFDPASSLLVPGVSLIIQVGLTAPEQYVHRLGTTTHT